MNDSPNRDVEMFTEAIQLPADQRAAYLERACAGDVKLRQQVEALLNSHDSIGDFLEESPQKTAKEIRSPISVGEKAGDHIGRYKLLQQIGEGGCGVVYMAEQEEPVRRRVALKIIKPGMDTKNVVARFEAERQALALMDHPNIARVFDAGATASGRPYFVMELVRGVKITEYCNQHSLTTEERLRLFVQVCQAVQHAHQKGIIHRDIKPSNILVTTTLEGVPLPVVIDFGIAKATTNQRLTDKTLFTAFEMLIGTPAYMSPEQAALTGVDVDTRTDIYSLGVLLYELLTSTTPFDAGKLLKAGLDEIRRVIREVEPISPSTRLSKMTGADLTTIARHHNSEPPKLIRIVHGDLDWIVMKTLEKDRTRRYATAHGIAQDVQRYLANEPISARPPSKSYKFKKLVLRNKLLFAGIGVISILLVTSLIIISASFAKERQARRETDVALQQAKADKAKAQTETDKSRQVTRFLEDMLQGVGPSVALGQDTKMLRGILDRTAERVGSELTNQPAVEAELRGLIGRVYFEIGNYDQAEKMQRAALAINLRLFGQESPATAASLNDLALALYKEGKLTEAENANEEALTIRRHIFGNVNEDVAASLNGLAVVYRHQRKLAESESLSRESIAIRQRLFGDESPEVADSLHNLAIVLGEEGKGAESEATARELLAIRVKQVGSENPLVAAALQDLAWAVGSNGKPAESESFQRQALTMQQKFLGDTHPDVSASLTTLGERMRRDGNVSEAHAVLNAALSVQRKLLGDESPAVLYSLGTLGLTLEQEGKWAEAEAAHREALTGWRKQFEIQDPHSLGELEGLVRTLIAQNKYDEAKKLLDESLTPALVQQSSSAGLLTLKCQLEVRRGQWQEAAADALLAFELQPAERDRYSMLAALLVKTHNHAAYDQLRQRLLAIAADTTNVFVADQVAKACLFEPASGVDLETISRLTDMTVTLGADNSGALPYFQVCKAFSEYRQGHFAEAAEWAQKPLNIPGIAAHGQAYAVLAMADWQLGQKDEARAMLASGDKLAPNVLPARDAEDPGNAWQAWLYARVTLDEATALIQPGITTDTNTDKP